MASSNKKGAGYISYKKEVPKGPVDCFFCSGHLPCRQHKPHQFDDVDLEMWIMGELSDDEFLNRES